MRALLLLVQTLVLLVDKSSPITVAPTWMSSPFVKAGQNNLINNVKTGNTSTPQATMTFSSAYSSPPHLAYGIINYEGIRSSMI